MKTSSSKVARRFVSRSLSRKENIIRLRTQLAQAAQKVYDEWDEARAGDLNGGGICQDIADALVGVLDKNGIDAGTVSQLQGDQHVYAIARVAEGVFEVDINPHLYERGAGYNWTKIPGVVFTSNDLLITLIDTDKDKFEELTESF